MRPGFFSTIVIAAMCAFAAGAGEGPFTVEHRAGEHVRIKTAAGKPVLRYVLGKLPAGEPKPSVESVAYLHPVCTPAGEPVTDAGPKDHLHHRGVFFGWVHMTGAKPADFWGWGAKAPLKARRIINRSAEVVQADKKSVTVRAQNAWLAEDVAVLDEECTIRVSERPHCFVIALEYRFTCPKGETRIEASPFSGFAYRGRDGGKLAASGPKGVVDLPNARHDVNTANWPVSDWYDFTYHGKTTWGVTVMDHPKNPRAPWYVNRGIHTLNPCIVSSAARTIKAGEPLILRYQVVVHDGEANSLPLSDIFREFAQEPKRRQ